MNVKIIYEDSEILVVVKPAGMATQSRKIGQMDLVSQIKNYRSSRGETPYIGLIHRLDQPVGGLLVLAKNDCAAAHLSRQIRNHLMKKYYKALVCGSIEEKGVLEDYLEKDEKSNLSRVAPKGKEGAKKARLSFQKLGEYRDIIMGQALKEPLSLIEIELETGRHHQIRVQMAHHGFPMWGDRKYNQKADGTAECALFAWKLGFYHPKTNQWMEFMEEPEFAMV